MTQPSRMDSARRSLRIARYAIGVIAAGALAGGAVVARAAHPGSHSRAATSSGEASVPSESSALLNAAGASSSSSISPAPAASPPVVQSSGS